MNPGRTLAITTRLLAQFRHDHRTLGILFVTPLIVLGLFAALLRADAPAPRLGVVNADAGPVGALVVEQLADSDAIESVELSVDEGRAQLEDGELSAYLELPSHFSASLTAGAPTSTLTLEGTDQQASARVMQAVQAGVLAGIGDYAPTVPSGVPVPSIPRLQLETTYLHGGGELDALDLLGGPFIGMIVFFLVYVVTSVSFLRERSLGTLERLMASPLRRTEIVVGYMLGFIGVAVVQAAEVLAFGLLVLGLYNAGSVWLIFGIEVLLALAAVNLGIFLSTFARTEFQAVQFIPLIVAPQVLLSGLIVPVASEPEWLQVISNLLPLTYAVDALREVMLKGADLASSQIQLDVAVIAGFCLVVIVAAAATLRREVA
ncbi:MAG: ABC transporter permease [Candidatus Limnocylindria bacterium]